MSALQIDLNQVLADKLGSKARWVPAFVVRWLERLIRKDRLNELLAHNYPRRGTEFCEGVFADLGYKVTADGIDNLPASPRFIMVSNHPLGGLDGLALILMMRRHYGVDPLFVVNDILMAVEPMRELFLPINKHGAQSRDAAADIDEALSGDRPVLMFPAGLVSRRGSDGKVRDLEWHKMFVVKAIRHHRDVVPVFFSGENSPFFYNFARWRQRLGIKLNIEMVRLPAEFVDGAGKEFTVRIGKPVPWQQLRGGAEAKATAAAIKDIVYKMQ